MSSFYTDKRYLRGRMGRKLVYMSELEFSEVSTVVIAAVVHYTRLARVARIRSLSISKMGFCCFKSLFYTDFYLKQCNVIFDTCRFIYLTLTLFGGQ